jgi:NAD(P)-dependent dehydrogenase (short-subunit alcohol dehydrogenase family)
MTGSDRRAAIITGGSQGIGASLVAGYVGHGWAVVANAGGPVVRAARGPLRPG